MAQIVKTRLAAGAAFAPYRGRQTQTTEGSLYDLVFSSPTITKTEDGRIRIAWVPLITVPPVDPERLRQLLAERNQARLVELALTHPEKVLLQIEIGDVQRQRFSESQHGAIQQQDQGAQLQRIHLAERATTRRRSGS